MAHRPVARPVQYPLPVGLRPDRPRGQDLVDDVVQLVPAHRLLEEVGGAQAHGFHGFAHVPDAGHDDHGRGRTAPLQLTEHVDAGPVGQPEVEQDRARPPLVEGAEPLPHGGRGHRPQAPSLQHVDADAPHPVVVIDHEDRRRVEVFREGRCHCHGFGNKTGSEMVSSGSRGGKGHAGSPT